MFAKQTQRCRKATTDTIPRWGRPRLDLTQTRRDRHPRRLPWQTRSVERLLGGFCLKISPRWELFCVFRCTKLTPLGGLFSKFSQNSPRWGAFLFGAGECKAFGQTHEKTARRAAKKVKIPTIFPLTKRALYSRIYKINKYKTRNRFCVVFCTRELVAFRRLPFFKAYFFSRSILQGGFP